MPERVGSHRDDIGELAAQEALARLAAYSEALLGVRGAALRELRERHAARPIAAVDAYRRGLSVLGSGVESFESWSSSEAVAWSRWPTRESLELRERVRVTRPRDEDA